MDKRDLYISLCFAGGNPDIAFLHNPDFTIGDYEEALQTDDYLEFSKKVEQQFLDKIDATLMGNLYRAQEAMQKVGPEAKTYPQIQKNYIEMLKLTKPIIERLKKFTHFSIDLFKYFNK